jgi:Methyltransferase FkbM domain/Protein-L-isoaspartate(D-aspartate) O-methyltransferase (PCMT)
MIRGLRAVKNLLVADHAKYRTVLFGPARGGRLPINLRRQFRMLWGLYEREIRSALASLVRPGDRCYDVGSGDGYYTMALARLASPDGWVCSIEQDERLGETLRHTVALNAHLGSRIETVCVALGGEVDPTRRRETLDHLVYDKGYPPPHFIKCDIEGEEYEFLVGAARTIAQASPRMLIEVHGVETEQHCCDFLRRQGYRLAVIDQAAFLPEVRPLPHNRWLCAVRT